MNSLEKAFLDKFVLTFYPFMYISFMALTFLLVLVNCVTLFIVNERESAFPFQQQWIYYRQGVVWFLEHGAGCSELLLCRQLYSLC